MAARLVLSRASFVRAWNSRPVNSLLRTRASPAAKGAGSVQSISVVAQSDIGALKPKPSLSNCKYCRMCGGGMQIVQPEGDKEWRHVCGSCGFVDYFNPKLVVGCIVEHEGKILLCKRAIQPCRGLWTVPAGFLEIGESSAAGAVRETWEEASAKVEVVGPYAHLDIPVIGQAYILFRAKLAPPYTFAAGPESLDVQLFEPADIPFDQLAFSSVSITLKHFVQDLAAGSWHFHHGVIVKVPGSAPNDPNAFTLEEHFSQALVQQPGP